MGAQRKDDKAVAMYELYQQGHSLAIVAAAFTVTRQSVYKMFALRGLPLRARPKPLPFVAFAGERYSLRKNGYYGRTRHARDYLHRAVWSAAHGAIPKGYDVHHADLDRLNNSLSNLVLIRKDEHSHLHSRLRKDR